MSAHLTMNWFNAGRILAMGQPPTPAGTQPDPKGQALNMIGMLVIMVVMFYFVLIRPQSKKAKDHAQITKASVAEIRERSGDGKES